MKGAAGPDVRVYFPFKMLPRRENGVFICWGVAKASVGGGSGFNPWTLSPSPGDPLPLQEEPGRGKSQEDPPDLGCSF